MGRATMPGTCDAPPAHFMRKDEDPAGLGYLTLLARQSRELRDDLSRARRAWDRATYRQLARQLRAYHWAMATGRRGTAGTAGKVRLRSGANCLTAHFRGDASDLFVLREVFTHQVYAFPYEKYAGPIRRIVDIGSNIGLAALYYNLRYPEAAVACVEPVPENVVLLHRNSSENGLGWHIEHAAVGADEGETTLYRSGWWASSSTNEAVAAARGTSAHRPEAALARPTMKVRTRTVGAVLAGLGWDQVDVLKMDIEGAEEAVLLRGDPGWLARVSVLVIDIHRKYVDADSIVARLTAGGLRSVTEHGAHSAVFVNAGRT
jgi:FkbM family methyltransferase